MQGGLLVDLTTNTHHEIHKIQMSVLVRLADITFELEFEINLLCCCILFH